MIELAKILLFIGTVTFVFSVPFRLFYTETMMRKKMKMLNNIVSLMIRCGVISMIIAEFIFLYNFLF